MRSISALAVPLTVAVLGAGIIGLFTSLELIKRGFRVKLIDVGLPGGRQATSYGNGTWVNEGAILPISLPGLWRSVPGFLRDPDGPFVVRWRDLSSVTPWLVRFLIAGRSWKRVEADIPARAALLAGAVSRYEKIAAESCLDDLLGERGVMYVYRGRDDFEQDRKGWDLRTKYGIEWSPVEGADLHEIAPMLSPDYTIGAKIKVALSLRDPGAFCAGLAKHFRSLGGQLINSAALGFSTDGRQLISVRTNEGDIDCDRAIICAGAASAHLARQAGNKIPLVSERGYHIEVLDCPLRLKTSLMPADGKMAVATTRTGLRLAGQVELAAPSVAPDWNRARIQLNHAVKMFPHMAEAIRQGPYDMWMGNRPSTPDGLPVIGQACGCNEVFYAFGHGHTGMAMSPATAALIADVVAGSTPSIDPRPYSPQRFRLVA